MEILIPNCACGERMLVSNVADAFVCQNCDGLQKQELDGKGRVATKSDHRFVAEMRKREREWYSSDVNVNALRWENGLD